MKYKDIVEIIAPCGSNCLKCAGYAQGEIKGHSGKLKILLGEFDAYAKRYSKSLPMFKNYPAFKEILDFFSQGSCSGCREGERKFPTCTIAPCIREKELDFCFTCSEYPCDRGDFDPVIKKRWIQMNNRMKEIGIEAYYKEIKDNPRYI